MKDIERALRAPEGHTERAAEAAQALLARADRDGLVDVAYGTVDSPLGPILAAVTPRGLVRVSYQDEVHVLEELSEAVSPRVLASPRGTEQVRRELEEYFAGRRHRFEVAIDWTLTSEGFFRRVLRATARVPYGSVTAYRDVAARAGSPRAYRAAGNALGSNPIPIVVPCHRVVHSGGGLGGYTGGLERKKFLLGLEGALA
ncbi:MAG: methylated-DNA--[protein]-cysteine S-methyltransferase [Actinomycetota bacterium]